MSDLCRRYSPDPLLPARGPFCGGVAPRFARRLRHSAVAKFLPARADELLIGYRVVCRGHRIMMYLAEN